MLPEFEKPRQTIRWAREGIAELGTIFRQFFDNVHAVNFTEFDPATGHDLYKIKLSDTLPDVAARRASEALLQTRNSFDQSLFASITVVTGRRPIQDIHFPWRTSPTDLEGCLQHKKCRIPAELWDALRRQEPYPTGNSYSGGDNVIRELARIANRKHTIGLALAGFVHGGIMPSVKGGSIKHLSIRNPVWDAVKNEMTLVEYAGDVQIEHNYKFAFSVTFSETEALKGVPALDGLSAFAEKAQAALEDLERDANRFRRT